MNIFKYFDSLLSGKHSLLALKYSDNTEKLLQIACYNKCFRQAKPTYRCGICKYPFSEKYLTIAQGTDFTISEFICHRCLLKHERMLCERCGKWHIVTDYYIHILHPVLGIYNIKEARQAFPEKDIASSKIALSSDEFTKLCDDIGASKYARSFQHGEIVCKYCWEDLTGFRNLVKQSIIDPQLEKLGCDLTFPDFSDLQYSSLDNSGFDKNVYINKINQHREKNLAKLHELDMQLLDELPSYSHQCMENALSPRQQARFINAKNSMKMDSTTSMAITEKILSEGLKIVLESS